MRRAPTPGGTIGLCAVAAVVELVLWHRSLMAMAHGVATRALFASWFVLLCGLGVGALAAMAMAWTGARWSRAVAAPVALAAALAGAAAIGGLVLAYATDGTFMASAMNWRLAAHETVATPAAARMHDMAGMEMSGMGGMGAMPWMGGQTMPAPPSLAPLLVPTAVALALATLYAFARRRPR